MEFHGTIQKGKIMLSGTQSELRKRYLASMKDGQLVREKITKEGPMKTRQQVKAHFGLVVNMVRQRLIDMGVDICGIPPNKEMVYDILKRACFGVGDNGEIVSLSQQTISQNMQAFENCRVWSATQLGLDIPDPSPNWRDKNV